MLPLGLFGDATFSGGNAVGLLINLGFYGELFVINLYFQQVLGYSALLAGLGCCPKWAWLLSDPCCRAGSPLAPAARGPPCSSACSSAAPGSSG
jgi:DHA2 family methylenomycin A resistance protein-like MFS transporter